MKPGVALLLSTAMLALLLAFLFASRGAGASAPGAASGYWDEFVANFVRRKVADTYVDQLDDEGSRQAFYRALDAYVDLDDYCDFIPPEEYRAWREGTSGRYAGLGVKINEVEDGLHVVGVLPDGPAARAGIRVGDTIVRAAGQKVAGLGIDEITALLKGEPRSSVRVGYIRGPRPETGPATGPEREVVAIRDVVRPPTVFTRRVGAQGEFALVRLADFAEETSDAYDAALAACLGERPAKGLILDLRHNGGGVLGVAVHVADRFLREGRLIVRMEGRARDASKTYAASDGTGKILDLPLVVLVDEWSASASEVVAGALQDHRRAVLVGVRTYGKFLVQSITEIPGREAAVKLTTSRYYTPSGRSYQGSIHRPRPQAHGEGRPEGVGLTPDVVVALTDEEAERLEAQWEDEEGRAWNASPRHPDVPPDWVDPQLERALELLRGEVVLQKIQRSQPSGRRDG
jgi:carboxyl-terminal processing protease